MTATTGAWLDGGKLIVRETQDVEPVLEANKRAIGERQTGDFRRVASIPAVVLHQWMQEGLDYRDRNAWPEIRRRLQSSDYAYLRTWEGRF